ncbi:MAG: class I SAM-dependent methyltransferase family protein [Candidatus Thermoplasmatota archaeon]|nr:class I SAM-dependent methyltransferase family protein [Candidatus Thermoplasmatota archaeon]
MQVTPFENIKSKVSQEVPSEVIGALPKKWEKIGSVVLIKVPDGLQKYQQIIGKVYAEELHCSTVLNDRGGISGVHREPNVEVIFGSHRTETIHAENGIRYRLDPQRIMFSSGNLKERQRMAWVSNAEETVVDLFAGIGYFTLPMAVYSRPKRIVACEINPLAYRYLCENVVLNHVSRIVAPVLGDNQQTAPKDCADRVILGYLKESQHFLPIALECLRNNVGILHYHELVPSQLIPEQPLRHIEEAGKRINRSVDLLQTHVIKSYAPGIYHVVLDVRVLE